MISVKPYRPPPSDEEVFEQQCRVIKEQVSAMVVPQMLKLSDSVAALQRELHPMKQDRLVWRSDHQQLDSRGTRPETQALEERVSGTERSIAAIESLCGQFADDLAQANSIIFDRVDDVERRTAFMETSTARLGEQMAHAQRKLHDHDDRLQEVHLETRRAVMSPAHSHASFQESIAYVRDRMDSLEKVVREHGLERRAAVSDSLATRLGEQMSQAHRQLHDLGEQIAHAHRRLHDHDGRLQGVHLDTRKALTPQVDSRSGLQESAVAFDRERMDSLEKAVRELSRDHLRERLDALEEFVRETASDHARKIKVADGLPALLQDVQELKREHHGKIERVLAQLASSANERHVDVQTRLTHHEQRTADAVRRLNALESRLVERESVVDGHAQEIQKAHRDVREVWEKLHEERHGRLVSLQSNSTGAACLQQRLESLERLVGTGSDHRVQLSLVDEVLALRDEVSDVHRIVRDRDQQHQDRIGQLHAQISDTVAEQQLNDVHQTLKALDSRVSANERCASQHADDLQQAHKSVQDLHTRLTDELASASRKAQEVSAARDVDGTGTLSAIQGRMDTLEQSMRADESANAKSRKLAAEMSSEGARKLEAFHAELQRVEALSQLVADLAGEVSRLQACHEETTAVTSKQRDVIEATAKNLHGHNEYLMSIQSRVEDLHAKHDHHEKDLANAIGDKDTLPTLMKLVGEAVDKNSKDQKSMLDVLDQHKCALGQLSADSNSLREELGNINARLSGVLDKGQNKLEMTCKRGREVYRASSASHESGAVEVLQQRLSSLEGVVHTRLAKDCEVACRVQDRLANLEDSEQLAKTSNGYLMERVKALEFCVQDANRIHPSRFKLQQAQSRFAQASVPGVSWDQLLQRAHPSPALGWSSQFRESPNGAQSSPVATEHDQGKSWVVSEIQRQQEDGTKREIQAQGYPVSQSSSGPDCGRVTAVKPKDKEGCERQQWCGFDSS